MANLTRNRVFVDITFNINTSKHTLLARVVKNDWNYLRLSGTSSQNSAENAKEEPVMSKAMEAYLKRRREYEAFLQQQMNEYSKGKKFLAQIMGKNPETFSQNDVDQAIAYLFPSALFDDKCRPLMKDPRELFKKVKEAQMDYAGRPHHYLFYTSKPKFAQLMHECAEMFEKLNEKHRNLSQGVKPPKKPVDFKKSVWITKDNLQKKLEENILDIDYKKFVESMELLTKHPYSYEASPFIAQYSCSSTDQRTEFLLPTNVVKKDGLTSITVERCRKKRCHGSVKLIHPGNGQIKVNDLDFINFFDNLRSRMQVLSPLVLTNMLGKVDVFGTVEASGLTNQAMIMRSGISSGLLPLISEEQKKKLKLAGYLENDPRTRERDKPGQKGARAKYTWLKR